MHRPTVAFLERELMFSTSRASGPGGQNVNKVETKVTLKFDLESSSLLSEEEKTLLREKLKSLVTKDGMVIVSSQEKRSQLQNKEEVMLKFDRLLAKAFEKKKKRKATKPSKSSMQKRMVSKKKNAEKKQWRQRIS